MTGSKDLRRAVQYLRMSTEHQRYSLDNQRAAIAEYASMEGYQVVQTYSDAGKSGLRLDGRYALQKLLSDCLSPERDFDAILVLDVSRWGRFQDPDQSAYCEYVCRGAGVRVVYVAETFDNDGGLVSSIVKHLKRVMAAEYSRELSEKITRAKLQQARLGFRQGGPACYGFRRQLVSADGAPRGILEPRQGKGLNTDRVTTIAGPAEEQEVVRHIFRMFVRVHGSFAGVARHLNAEGIFNAQGRPWTGKTVSYLIRNELCVGTYIYNRINRRLRSEKVLARPAQWVRAPADSAIVPSALFAKANRLAGKSRQKFTDAELLTALRRHLKKIGTISPQIINADNDMPHTRTYEVRFGSLRAACELIGHEYKGKRKWYPATGGYWSREDIIAAVQLRYRQRGQMSARWLKEDPSLPGLHVVQDRFGGLTQLYQAAGIELTDQQRYWTRRKPRQDLSVPEGLTVGPLLAGLLRDLQAPVDDST